MLETASSLAAKDLQDLILALKSFPSVREATMAASLLAVKNSSLLPSQSIFNEVQSIHDTGFFHEMETMSKECGLSLVSCQASQPASCTSTIAGSWLYLATPLQCSGL